MRFLGAGPAAHAQHAGRRASTQLQPPHRRTRNPHSNAHMFLPQGRQRVLDTLAEVQERNRDLRSLVASFMELKQLLLDMAVSVEAQGEHLDNIEKQVRV